MAQRERWAKYLLRQYETKYSDLNHDRYRLYPIILFCFAVVALYLLVDSSELVIDIVHGCLTDAEGIVWLPQWRWRNHGPLTRYVKLRVTHAPGMPGTFSPQPRSSDPDMHPGTCVTHVPWCMSGSLTRGLLWSRWRGKCSRHSRRMHNTQFYVSGKRPMKVLSFATITQPQQITKTRTLQMYSLPYLTSRKIKYDKT